MLKFILIATISAPDLAAVEKAYRDHLGYRIVERGKISKALAGVWGAPAAAGRAFLLMQPESGEQVYLRFVQAAPTAGYAPMRTVGWNATEILVKDPDDLAQKLRRSPFRIIGPPRNLSSNENIRAMQVLGPADEVLYLTRITPGKSAFNLGSATTYVDRIFIVVLGGKDLEAMRDFYATKMRMPVTPPSEVRISVLSNAYGLDPERQHRLSIARLPERFLIEIDEYPPEALTRPRRRDDLPPGVSIVSFGVESIDARTLNLIKPPTALEERPYGGKRVAVTVGAAGELIELVETKSP